MAKKKTKVSNHVLIPVHTKLSEADKKEVLEKYSITPKELPSMHTTDPAIQGINVKVGDVIMIERKSPTSGKTVFYRSVIE